MRWEDVYVMCEDLVKRLRSECALPYSALKDMREAADAIEELSKPKWIPVTERLPDNIGEEVLVCNEDYGKSDLGFATVAVYNGNGWLECWDRKMYLASITHWMPLPEPPKEE